MRGQGRVADLDDALENVWRLEANQNAGPGRRPRGQRVEHPQQIYRGVKLALAHVLAAAATAVAAIAVAIPRAPRAAGVLRYRRPTQTKNEGIP